MQVSMLRSVSLFVLASAALSAQAAPHLIDFDGVPQLTPVGTTYLASDGVTFTGANFLIRSNAGGSGNFTNNPSGTGIAYQPLAGSITMNSLSAFTGAFGFYYAANSTLTVSVFSGLNGTGSLLGTLNLGATPTPFSVFSQQSLAFSGGALSAVITGNPGSYGIDNVSFNTSSVPGPAAALPFALMALRRRKRA